MVYNSVWMVAARRFESRRPARLIPMTERLLSQPRWPYFAFNFTNWKFNACARLNRNPMTLTPIGVNGSSPRESRREWMKWGAGAGGGKGCRWHKRLATKYIISILCTYIFITNICGPCRRRRSSLHDENIWVFWMLQHVFGTAVACVYI